MKQENTRGVSLGGLLIVALAGGACGAPTPPPADPSEEAGNDAPSPSPPTTGDAGGTSRMEAMVGEMQGETVADERSGAGDPDTEAWIARLRELLPGEFCKDGTFFRACFKITQDECTRATVAHYDPCVTQHRSEIPPIRDAESGRVGGEILGRCVGIAYQTSFEQQGKFTNTAKCNDPNAW